MKIAFSFVGVLLTALSAAQSVNGQIMHNPCNEKRDEGEMAVNLGASILTMSLVSILDDASSNGHTSRRLPFKPCLPPATRCYCELPSRLFRECDPVISNYNKGRIPQNCENYNKYVECGEESKFFCTPDRPAGWRRGLGHDNQ